MEEFDIDKRIADLEAKCEEVEIKLERIRDTLSIYREVILWKASLNSNTTQEVSTQKNT